MNQAQAQTMYLNLKTESVKQTNLMNKETKRAVKREKASKEVTGIKDGCLNLQAMYQAVNPAVLMDLTVKKEKNTSILRYANASIS